MEASGNRAASRQRAAKGGKARKPEATKRGTKAKDQTEEDSDDVTRKLGLRGAAPWAARHAAKHAAEARARNSLPAPPGSARATLRVPEGAEEIKERVARLHQQLGRIRALQKRLDRGFYELGVLLCEIRDQRLHEAKGYGSFEQFLEREIELGKATSLALLRVPTVFKEDAALEAGLEATLAALGALDAARTGTDPRNNGGRLPLKPPAVGR